MNRLPWIFALLIFHRFANVSTSYSKPSFHLRLKLDSVTEIAEVDSRFLSFTIDSHHLALGWKKIDLADKQLAYLAKNLNPAYLRVGGTAADIIEFVTERPLGLPEISKSQSESCSQSCLDNFQDSDYRHPSDDVAYVPGKDFLALGSFIQNANLELVYDLNVLLRTKNGRRWNCTNARELLRFMSTNGIQISGFELGNEPDSFHHVFNVTVKSPHLAQDFATLKNLIKSFKIYNSSIIIGPDTTRPKGKRSRSLRYLKGFLKHGGGKLVDKVTFHQYYFDGKDASVNDFVDVATMNVLKKQINRTANALKRFAPGKSLWIGETGSGWGGGCKNISDRYASSFMWLDKLGLAARYGVDVVFRQTLIGGNYGLLDCCAVPTPDYYISLLHKRLVGRKVLETLVEPVTPVSSVPQGMRLYFHCTHLAFGALTIFGLNVEPSAVTIEIPGHEGKIIHEYLLHAPNLTSRFSYLNGIELKLNPDGSLPPLLPMKRRFKAIIPSFSMGFWVLPHANLSVCRQN